MITAIGAALLSATLAAQQPDTVITIDRGTRLSIENPSGTVVIEPWDRDAIHVRADTRDADRVVIDRQGPTLHLRSRGGFALPGPVDYRISAPAWLAVEVSGIANDVEITGLTGDIDVQTIRGDLHARRIGGFARLTSIEGGITIEDASGAVEARTVNDDIIVRRASGDLDIETANGEVLLDGIRATRVSARTLNGDLVYDGEIHDEGRYRLATHNGGIVLVVPEGTNATVDVSTFNGEFRPDFPVELTTLRSSRRLRFVLGDGNARIEIEAFQGDIRLRRPE